MLTVQINIVFHLSLAHRFRTGDGRCLLPTIVARPLYGVVDRLETHPRQALNVHAQ